MESSPKVNIGIPQEQREEIAAGLSRLLADTYVLYGKTHGFHWNVTGPMFNTLHLMFMDQYTELWNSLDEIAERIRALGVVAPYGGATLAGLASIKKSPSSLPPSTWCGNSSLAMKPWPEPHAVSFLWRRPRAMNPPLTC